MNSHDKPAQVHDISRLPVWGQKMVRERDERITRLLATVRTLEEKLAGSYPESDTFADPYDDHPVPLGMGQMVRFNGTGVADNTFDVRMLEGDLVIRSNGAGSSADAAIIPQSASTIRIRMIS